MNKKGFTLIELLIVVAIIAILAAIAVPNFLEAQVRSKVSRVKADMRSMVTGIESYAVENNNYPVELRVPDGGAGSFRFPHALTTPVAYITQAMPDPFRVSTDGCAYTPPTLPSKDRTFMYIRILAIPHASIPAIFSASNGGSDEGNDPPSAPRLDWFGKWCISSYGPDKICGIKGYNAAFAGFIYDPTNGTVSPGDILKRQKSYTKDNF